MGGFVDLPTSSWFGDFDVKVSIHVIDSSRPRSMANLYSPGENGERVVLWDDGDAEKFTELRKAWEVLEVRQSLDQYINFVTDVVRRVRTPS